MTFWPPPGPQRAGKCAIAHPIHVSNLHTKFSRISSNGLGGDSVTDGRMEAIAVSRSPFFLKKNMRINIVVKIYYFLKFIVTILN